MPNWCDNYLIVNLSSYNNNCTNEDIDNFYNENLQKFGDDVYDLDFNCCVPMPEEIKNSESPSNLDEEKKKELIDKYGADNWYDWSINNWGTKWNTKDIYCDRESNGSLTYNFTTPWGPPDKWLLAIINKYPDLEIKLTYEEAGMDFGGEIHYNGELIMQEQYTLSEHVWENCDKEFIDKAIAEVVNSEDSNDLCYQNITEQVIEYISDEIYNAYSIESYILEYLDEYFEKVKKRDSNNIDNVTILEYGDEGKNIFKLTL